MAGALEKKLDTVVTDAPEGSGQRFREISEVEVQNVEITLQ